MLWLGSGAGTGLKERERSPSIHAEFFPPLAVPMVGVMAARDSVVSPTLATDVPVVMVVGRMFPDPNTEATVVAISPGVVVWPMALMNPLVSLLRTGVVEDIHTVSPLLPMEMLPLILVSGLSRAH